MDSGTALLPLGTNDPSHSNFTFVAGQFGCGNVSAEAELECFRNVSTTDSESFLKSYSDNGTQRGISFQPVVDNRTKFANFTERALAKNFTMVVSPFRFDHSPECLETLMVSSRRSLESTSTRASPW